MKSYSKNLVLTFTLIGSLSAYSTVSKSLTHDIADYESAGSLDHQKSNFASNIKTVQEILNSLDYNSGTEDGKMGPNTLAALERFQKDNDLPPTGKLDAETMEALQMDDSSLFDDEVESSITY